MVQTGKGRFTADRVRRTFYDTGRLPLAEDLRQWIISEDEIG
jgi:hypothetical protein